MEFNDTKREVLRISRSKTPFQHTYCLHGRAMDLCILSRLTIIQMVARGSHHVSLQLPAGPPLL